MSRYVKGIVRAQGWVKDECFSPDPGPVNMVSVSENEAVDTGLVWPTGEPAMRIPNPVGFGRDDEW